APHAPSRAADGAPQFGFFGSARVSDPAALRRSAAVVRDRRHVADRRDLEARHLQRAQGGLAPRARSLHEDRDRAHAVLLRDLGRVFRRQLRRERRRLARSEEHTSELQSRENLVCRLLLEKKKKITKVQSLTIKAK